jgi:hypothetical protein
MMDVCTAPALSDPIHFANRNTPMDDSIEVTGSLYLLVSKQRCWKCNSTQEVIAIASEALARKDMLQEDTGGADELIIFSEVEEMPAEIASYLQQYHPRYGMRYSQTANCSYFANSCE